jgi:hypothetical protein
MPKQTRTRSAVKKKGAVEFRGLPFDQWLKRFNLLLILGSAADRGLRRWIADKERIAGAPNVPSWNCRLDVLEVLHDMTSPSPILAEDARRANEHVKDSLKEFVRRIDSLNGHIGGKGIFSAPLAISVDASELVKSLDSAAKAARKILALIDHPYTPRPKIIDQCLPLLLSSTYCCTPKLTEKQTCALAWLAMRAHGYRDNELDALGKTSGNGTARKHAEAYRRRALAITGETRDAFRLYMALKYHFSVIPASE